jgi:hypothetical protein
MDASMINLAPMPYCLYCCEQRQNIYVNDNFYRKREKKPSYLGLTEQEKLRLYATVATRFSFHSSEKTVNSFLIA